MKEVKVRLKIENSRLIGVIQYPNYINRFSDFVNDNPYFLKILHPQYIEMHINQSILLVPKKNIYYMHCIEEEYTQNQIRPDGSFFQVTITLKSGETMTGFIFCSYNETNLIMEIIMKDPANFIKIKNPVILETNEKYNFLAVEKTNILYMEIQPEPVISSM